MVKHVPTTNTPEGQEVGRAAVATLEELLLLRAGSGRGGPEGSPSIVEQLLWLVPGDSYRVVRLDLSTERATAEQVIDVRGRGKSFTVLVTDDENYQLNVDTYPVLKGAELPVGSMFEIRGFSKLYVQNDSGLTGDLVLFVETTSLGR